MKVYIAELERTATLYLYDLNEKDCAEQFVLKNVGLNDGEFVRISEELKQEAPYGTDLSDVDYAMSEVLYKDLIPVLEAVQQAYDTTKDEMIESDWNMDDVYKYIKEKGESESFYIKRGK